MKNRLNQPATWMPILLAVALVAGLLVGRVLPTDSVVKSRGAAHDKLQTILQYIEGEYVDHIDGDSLLEALLPDLLTSLDPHSVYIPASDFKAVNEELEGSFSGIGISFNMLTDTISVIEIISGGPAEAVGLLPGDRIITINDSVAAGKGWSSEKVITQLRGPKGSKVKVGVKRDSSKELLEFELTRDDIAVNSIDASYMIDDDTGYIRVNKFGRTTFDEFFVDAVTLLNDGAENLIIDLRGNGGGYMEMAIAMANEFLPEGAEIVSTRGRRKSNNRTEKADGLGRLKEVGLTVLMDEYSASASEIFAGAIQDNDRGLVIGRRSFGKGLVQQQYVLPDSSAIRLTIARYYTPSGRSIQKTYEHGGTKAYQEDLIQRYDRGEMFNADSVKLDMSFKFFTGTGREVYGGGGIMPDIFVPADTTGVTSYYLQVANKGELQKFAFDYNDKHRKTLSQAQSVAELLKLLPDDETLLQQFAEYAERDGIPQRWYYINISSDLIVNQLKSIIARNALGTPAYYEVDNLSDPVVKKALEAIRTGSTRFPIAPLNKK